MTIGWSSPGWVSSGCCAWTGRLVASRIATVSGPIEREMNLRAGNEPHGQAPFSCLSGHNGSLSSCPLTADNAAREIATGPGVCPRLMVSTNGVTLVTPCSCPFRRASAARRGPPARRWPCRDVGMTSPPRAEKPPGAAQVVAIVRAAPRDHRIFSLGQGIWNRCTD
jgi:hypothetical protein